MSVLNLNLIIYHSLYTKNDFEQRRSIYIIYQHISISIFYDTRVYLYIFIAIKLIYFTFSIIIIDIIFSENIAFIILLILIIYMVNDYISI